MQQGLEGRIVSVKPFFRGVPAKSPLRYLGSFFCFWRPSVARRITFYFIIFGMLIFFVSTFLYQAAGKRTFLASTGQLIQDQFNRYVNASEADFFWKRIDHSEAELYRIFQILKNLSSEYSLITEVAICSRKPPQEAWYRLYFNETDVLRSEQLQDPLLDKLERRLKRSFHRMSTMLLSEDGVTAMFVNLTNPGDTRRYFLRIGLDRADVAAFLRRQFQIHLLFLLIIIVISRLLAHVFVRKIARPIESLSQSVTKVAKGDLSKLVPVATRDEIGELAKNFNTMILELREWERVRKIEFELEKGQAIQREFLPRTIPQLPAYDIAARFQPAGKVSGDFYDVFPLPGGALGMVIADVCDKGVGSALYMALFRSLIRVYAMESIPSGSGTPPASGTGGCVAADGLGHFDPMLRLQAVSSTNNYIAQFHGEEGMFATVFFGVLDTASGQLCYVNAGHEPPFIIGESGVKQCLSPTGPAVGLMPNMTFQVGKVRLDPGDTLVGYTDGVTEARSPGDALFSRARLQSLLGEPSASAAELLDRITSELSRFIGSAPRYDDITLLAIRREGR